MGFGRMRKEDWRLWRRHPEYKGNNRHEWQKQRNEQKKFFAGMNPDMRAANYD